MQQQEGWAAGDKYRETVSRLAVERMRRCITVKWRIRAMVEFANSLCVQGYRTGGWAGVGSM